MSIYIYIYIYIYLYTVYFYIYIGEKTKCSRVLLQKNETFSCSFPFFAKELCLLCILFRSLQKIIAFFVFFSILKKRTEHSFGSHKSPKTQEKNRKERTVSNGKERSARPCSSTRSVYISDIRLFHEVSEHIQHQTLPRGQCTYTTSDSSTRSVNIYDIRLFHEVSEHIRHQTLPRGQ